MSELFQRELNGLPLTAVPSFNNAVRLRAASWFNLVHRLGIHIPFFAIHDMGQLWAFRRTKSSAPLGVSEPRLEESGANVTLRALLRDYAAFIASLAESEVIKRAQSWRLNDDVIAVLLTKILTGVFRAWAFEDKSQVTRLQLPLDGDRYDIEKFRVTRPLDHEDSQYYISYLNALLERELQVLHAVEQIDLDTLRLLGLFQGEMGNQSPLEMVDLLGLFTMPMVNDIVNFSLQIIPSVLEATKLKDAQIVSMDGYEGVERVGHVDNLMLTEFAYDDEIFFQKFLDNELFYYSRTRAREEEKKLHYLLVDASASMRGRRSVFARGVALAMIKKLLLQHEKPVLRFFDAQLYQAIEVDTGFSVPYLLSFRSERGRNYKKVFEQILFDIRRIKEREKQEVILYILTHGQCHIPKDLVMRLREVAYLFGVYILPGDPIELEYLDILHKSRLIQSDALQSTSNRKRAAIDILSEV